MDIVFLDNHLLVVGKPPGQLVQGDKTGDLDLLSEAKAYLKSRFDKPGNVFLGLVHRIDRPASGLIVFGRTSKAAGRLSKLFREREVEKRYVLLVDGRLGGEGELRHHVKKGAERTLVRDGLRFRENGAVSGGSESGWQEAILQFRPIHVFGSMTLVEVELETGRKHQIRAQMAHLGHPIVGDVRYGGPKWRDPRALALHCWKLGFRHPVGGRSMFWTTAPPAVWPTEVLAYLSSRSNYLAE